MKTKSKKSKPSSEPHVDQLYKAVQNYVERGGGSLIVIGGVQILEWPSDKNKYVFHISVKCLGRKPKFT